MMSVTIRLYPLEGGLSTCEWCEGFNIIRLQDALKYIEQKDCVVFIEYNGRTLIEVRDGVRRAVIVEREVTIERESINPKSIPKSNGQGTCYSPLDKRLKENRHLAKYENVGPGNKNKGALNGNEIISSCE